MHSAAIQVFTIGFAGKSAEQFFSILVDSGIRHLIDARLLNRSQLAGYAKRTDLEFFLRSIVGAGYSHLPAFAPTKQLLDDYKKGKTSWEAYERQYRALLEERKPHKGLTPEKLDRSCLLCAEPSPDRCHRRLAAEYLRQVWPGIVITHL